MPFGVSGGRLRCKQAASRDERAAGSQAERGTVATPGLLGQARPGGEAPAASVSLVHQLQPQLGIRMHFDSFLSL